MFWKKKQEHPPTIVEIPKEEKKKDLLARDIFSAYEALEMGIEARNKKRNDQRKEIFRNIKFQIQHGLTKSNMSKFLFEDGNDIYFEGLGYKVREIWINHNGEESFEEPVILEQPQSGIIQTGTGTWGQQMVFRSMPQNLIQVSWEK